MTIRRHTFAASVLALVAVLFAGTTTGAIAQAPDRESVERGFLEEVVPALKVPIGWTGSVAGCNPGAPSAAAQSATLTTINYVRELAGLDPVSFDPALSAKAQKAALIMEANDDLSHEPPSTWACWTQEGDEAAGSSNLALGNSGAAAILAYMEDSGEGNTLVGHRRWILRPDAATMGSGSTSGANALWIFGADAPGAAKPAWVPWPVAGYFPSPLEPLGRWSLSSPDPEVTFEGAQVTVVDPSGASLPVQEYPPEPNYANNTLVWEVTGVELPRGQAAAEYTVTVTNIGRSDGAPAQTFSYDVLFVSPPLRAAAPPPITGEAKVGERLRADAGEWDPEPDSFSYQWLRSGVAIPGADEAAYTATPQDLGEELSVEVTATLPGWRDSRARSVGTADVAEGDPLEAVVAPTISGRKRVGATLRVNGGEWEPAADALSFEWFRNGELVGDGGTTYRLTRSDRGARITVIVTATKLGYENGTATTRATRRILPRA